MKIWTCLALASLCGCGALSENPGSAPPTGMTSPDLGSAAEDGGPPEADGFSAPDLAPGPITRKHWKLVFQDDFRGKPDDSPRNNYCYDAIKPQCHIWTGGTTHDCDYPIEAVDREVAPPVRENFAAVLNVIDPTHDWNGDDLATIQARYSELLSSRLAGLDKCTWTLFEAVNWMSTDYAGHWSSRFDATQAQVHTDGRGYLELSARRAPVDKDCIFGGTPSGAGNVNCQLKGFAPGVLVSGVSYFVDTSAQGSGVYYAASGSACPHGGALVGNNCRVHDFAAYEVESTGVSYWVDTNFPGVYYANTAYACREHIDYSDGVHFKNVSCEIINGGMHSAPTDAMMSPLTEAQGRAQKHGRFEVKLKIPSGKGAFPAAWLMPVSGGWPFDGGEIDILESRDDGDDVFQTYHHGKCFKSDYSDEAITYTDDAGMSRAVSSGVCGKSGLNYDLTSYSPHNLYVGKTTVERGTGEFHERDHVFAVEWSDTKIEFFINNVKTNTLTVGTDPYYHQEPAVPTGMRPLAAHNFPTSPFYWILNHSTWVQPQDRAGFVPQSLFIDYVRSYTECASVADYCPCGGYFVEGTGCVLTGSETPSCASPPQMATGPGYAIYQSECRAADLSCVAGGEAVGAECRVHTFAPGEVSFGVNYWIDADPRWPGLYYAPIAGACPYGGSLGVNCQVVAFASGLLEQGVDYRVVVSPGAEGVYYTADFRN